MLFWYFYRDYLAFVDETMNLMSSSEVATEDPSIEALLERHAEHKVNMFVSLDELFSVLLCALVQVYSTTIILKTGLYRCIRRRIRCNSCPRV